MPEQAKVRNERALGKQRLLGLSESPIHGVDMDEQITEENVCYVRDEQIDKDLLKLVGPANLDALIVFVTLLHLFVKLTSQAC